MALAYVSASETFSGGGGNAEHHAGSRHVNHRVRKSNRGR